MNARSATRKSNTLCTTMAHANDSGTSSVAGTVQRSPGNEPTLEKLCTPPRIANGSAPTSVP